MKLKMKNKRFVLVIAALSFTSLLFGQSKAEEEVSRAVETLKAAMISGDSAQLAAIVTEDLSYGHSTGKIQNKKSFIESFLNGSTDFVTINLLDQKIQVHGKTAVVRHILDATNNDYGKPGTVKLSILTVWVKIKGKWKMMARQAVHPPQ